MTRRRTITALGLSAAAVATLTLVLLDPIVAAIYAGRGPQFLVDVIEGRDVHPVGFYQDLAAQRLRVPLLVLALLGALTAIGAASSPKTRARIKDVIDGRLGLLLTGLAVIGAVAFLLSRQGEPPLPAVVLSEVVTSNANLAPDEDGDHPDWIELWNTSEVSIDLTGYTLAAANSVWGLPTKHLQPNERIVVYASGKDRVRATEIHTDFRLPRTGVSIELQGPDGSDRIEVPADLPRNASFGRSVSDPRRVCYHAFPMPGAPNAEQCFEDARLGAPVLSLASGFYESGTELTIQPALSDAPVFFTLDGSFPDPVSNPSSTRRYGGPLQIALPDMDDVPLGVIPTCSEANRVGSRSGVGCESNRFAMPELAGLEFDRAVVVRARHEFSSTTAATYFVGGMKPRRDLPIVSLITTPANLFDPGTGIAVTGSDPENPNFQQRGREWERPLLEDLHDAVILDFCHAGEPICRYQTSVGLRIHGGYSRWFPQKSLRIYARNDYGESTFTEPFFAEDPALTGHRRLILRNSGNDTERTMLADGFLQSLMTGFAADRQAYQPAVLFINGHYWGIQNIRERYDVHYIETIYGIPAAAVQIGTPGTQSIAEDWTAFLGSIEALDREDPAFVAAVQSAIDVESFLDMIIAGYFTGNDDWVPGNIRLWRASPSSSTQDLPFADGRWRWLINDLDAWGHRRRGDANYRPFEDRLRPSADLSSQRGYPFLFHAMMQNSEFRAQFLFRMAHRLNTNFAPETSVAALDVAADVIRAEIDAHAPRWQTARIFNWHAEIDRMRNFLKRRPEAVFAQLVDHFELSGLTKVTITELGEIQALWINGHETSDWFTDPISTEWTGRYFSEGRLELAVEPRPGVSFVGWRVTVVDAEGQAFLEWDDETGRPNDEEITLTLDGVLQLKVSPILVSNN